MSSFQAIVAPHARAQSHLAAVSAFNTIPLLGSAVAFGGGIAAATAGWGSIAFWIGLLILALIMATAGLVWQRMRLVSLGPLVHTVALLIALSAVGGLRYMAWEAPSPDSLRTLTETPLPSNVRVQGTIHGPVVTSEYGTRFVLQARRLVTPTDTLRISDRMQVRWHLSPWDEDPPPFPAVTAGEEWWMTGRLRTPPPPRNPADFDYGAYLRHHDIHWTLTVDAPSDVDRQAPAPPGYARSVHQARAYVNRVLNMHIANEDARSIQQALLLGDRSAVDDAYRTSFAATGLMHLLAVSGLHVLLVGMLAYQLLRPLLMRLGWSRRRVDRTRAAATLLLLLAYMALTGMRPSVVRATLMATLLIGGTLTQRVYAPLNALGAAALVLLWIRPAALYDAGFQLSFAAVLGIVLFNPKLMALCPDTLTHGATRRFFTQSVTVSAAALVGTTPFLLLHFGFVAGAGLLLNVIAIPLTALALSAGGLTIATSALTPLASVFGGAADVLTQCLLAVAQHGAHALGHWHWSVPHVPPGAVALVVGVLLAFGGMRRWMPRHGLLALSASIVVMVWVPLTTRPLSPTLDVLFFDVGQSDAALVRTPDGRHLLVDTGLRTPHSDAATRTILPHLRYTGTRMLDAVLVTHPDADHLGGLPTLLQAGVVEAVWDNGVSTRRPLYEEARQWIDQLNVAHHSFHQRDTLRLGAYARVVGFSPPADASSAVFHDANNQSVVAALQYGNVQFLFPGDVEASVERWLVQTHGIALQSNVVAVPHHGSSTSSTPAFVNAVAYDSTHAVVSAGAANRFGFPDSTVVARWQHVASAVHETAEGAVWLRTDGSSIWKVSW